MEIFWYLNGVAFLAIIWTDEGSKSSSPSSSSFPADRLTTDHKASEGERSK
jgi:hypothetical protein